MTDLLTVLDTDAVRAAIQIGMKASALPDTIIQMPIYAGAAVLDVKARFPLAEEAAGDALLHVTNAVNLLTAAYLVEALPSIKRRRTAEGDEVEMATPSITPGALRERAGEEIAAAIGELPTTAAQPTMFTLARGCRGR